MNSILREIYTSLGQGQQFTAKPEDLLIVIETMLETDLREMDQTLLKILPYTMAYNIRTWPGWKSHSQSSFEAAFFEFVEHLKVTLSHTVNVAYDAAAKRLLHTQNVFNLNISGTPDMLFSLSIVHSGEDIIFNQVSELQLSSQFHKTKVLLNWLHVAIELKSPVLTIRRANLPEYRRCLTSKRITRICQGDFIESVEILDKLKARKAYTHEYLVDTLLGYIKVMPKLVKGDFDCIQMFIQQFLQDVLDINIKRDGHHTIADNTAVLFNIGKNQYYSSKRISNELYYHQILTPKVQTSLVHLAEKDEFDQYLNAIKSKNSHAELHELPQLMFSCTFCDQEFGCLPDIKKHLNETHGRIPMWYCTKCKRQISMIQCSKKRWIHNCH